MHDDHDDQHDLGLAHDLGVIARRGLGRRGLFSIMGGVGVVAVAGCADDGLEDATHTTSTPSASTSSAAAGATTATSSTSSSTEEIPEETGGPYPGDGSNGPNVLTESGIVRSDLTTSFGTASGIAEGVPLTIRLKVLNVSGGSSAAYLGAAVYLWHCNRDGEYSLYSDSIVDENYLRGVQEADADGAIEFTTIFPAAYSGRWPHAHFEVYPTLADATSASNKARTTQLAFPEDVCSEVYENADGYDASVANLAATSLDSDMVFSDGWSLQLATVTGSIDEGYVATLTVPV